MHWQSRNTNRFTASLAAENPNYAAGSEYCPGYVYYDGESRRSTQPVALFATSAAGKRHERLDALGCAAPLIRRANDTVSEIMSRIAVAMVAAC